MPTASILLRLSKQAGDAKLSLTGTEQDCRALAERHGYEVAAVRVDDGLSGAVRNRPGFIAWLDDARSGAVDCLISWSGDRLSRKGVNVVGVILDVLEGKDSKTGRVTRQPVRLLTADDGIDSDDSDDDGFRVTFSIKQEFARAERKRIVRRNKATQRRLRSEPGRFRGGLPPYGYTIAEHPEGGLTLVLDDTESAVVREIAERVLGGESLYQVAQKLNERRVPPRTATVWHRKNAEGRLTEKERQMGPASWRIPTLQSLLTGDHSAGYVSHRGQVLRGEDGLPVRPVLDDETLDRLRLVVRPPSTKRHADDPPDRRRHRPGRRPARRAVPGLAPSSASRSLRPVTFRLDSGGTSLAVTLPGVDYLAALLSRWSRRSPAQHRARSAPCGL